MPQTNKNNLILFFSCFLLLKTCFLNLPLLSAQQQVLPDIPNAKPDSKDASSDYVAAYDKGAYNEALKIVSGKLISIYSAKSDNLKIYSDYFIARKEDERKNIDNLFRSRKTKFFFIEDNQELSRLHLYSARCFYKLENGEAALNHYFESLRYNPLDFQKDDIVFYEIAQVYKSFKNTEAYMRSLETAYSLNPTNFEYSLELGIALSKTNNRKKAIFHLERYIESRGDDIPDNNLFLTVGNLNEDIGEYLETAKYYKKYLSKKNDDGYVNFALGHLAYYKTGDHKLALDCLEKSIKYLPEKELFRKAKAMEYQADIYMHDLDYVKAIQFYLETKKYHDKIQTDIRENTQIILKTDTDIRNEKSVMKTENLHERYDKYQKLNLEKGRLELINRELNYEFSKINAGKIRWNIALSYERTDQLNEAIQYYNEAVSFDYNANEARDKIRKLKLKIKRGC